ncbi:MAG: hypothetical protein A4E48_00024 [Methanosaeta sp. PtaU1.Bin060]|jgi:hypothetical protein|nr:hypothetical protein [Candidatus Methanosuratincola sp.]OPY55497.1 MAG: hypothetical protein A4E48_00024 [Methanosaeta sp. PtaU1.Bin060]
MTGSFANYWEEKILKHIFGLATYSALATLYVGVCTGGVTEDGTVTGEPAGNGYARVAVTNNATGWDFSQVAGLSKIQNHAAVTFPEASGSWGTITDVFLADAASGGNILAFATLDESKVIGSGDTLQFDAGDLGFTLD